MERIQWAQHGIFRRKHSSMGFNILIIFSHLFATLSVAPSRALLSEGLKIFQEEVEAIKTVPGLVPNFISYPLQSNAIKAMKQRGGNALGIDRVEPLFCRSPISRLEFTLNLYRRFLKWFLFLRHGRTVPMMLMSTEWQQISLTDSIPRLTILVSQTDTSTSTTPRRHRLIRCSLVMAIIMCKDCKVFRRRLIHEAYSLLKACGVALSNWFDQFVHFEIDSCNGLVIIEHWQSPYCIHLSIVLP